MKSDGSMTEIPASEDVILEFQSPNKMRPVVSSAFEQKIYDEMTGKRSMTSFTAKHLSEMVPISLLCRRF